MTEEMIQARARLYWLLSVALGYPDTELRQCLEDASFVSRLMESVAKLEGYGLLRCALSLKGKVEKYGAKAFSAVSGENLELFGQDRADSCPVYELGYLKGPLFMHTGQLADIAGFYKAFGLEVGESTKDRVDHISIEIEFMYFLALKEAHILKNGKTGELDICKDAQRKFIADHLGRWTGVFHGQVKKRCEQGFYSLLTDFLDKFVAREAEELGAKPEKIEKDNFIPDSTFKEDEFTCGVSGSKQT
jgi:DMSO reductase family type II enzyme chaperone